MARGQLAFIVMQVNDRGDQAERQSHGTQDGVDDGELERVSDGS